MREKGGRRPALRSACGAAASRLGSVGAAWRVGAALHWCGSCVRLRACLMMAAAGVGNLLVSSTWGPCRFSDSCTRAGCRYAHPRDGGGASSSEPREHGSDDSAAAGMTWIRPDGPYGNFSAAATLPGRREAVAPAAATQPQLPPVGSVVEAVYEADGQWYKASLDKVDGQDLWVSFVDYDNEAAVVKPSNVRAVHQPASSSAAEASPQQRRATAARSPQKQGQSVLDRLGTKKAEESKGAQAAPAVLSRVGPKGRGTAKPTKGIASGKRKSTPHELPPKKAKSAAGTSAAASTAQQKLPATRNTKNQAGQRAPLQKGRPVAAAGAAAPSRASPVMRFLLKKESTGQLTASQRAELSRLRKEASGVVTSGGGAATSMSPTNRTAQRRPAEQPSASLELDLEVRV
eukprot:COSAG02_NODE_5463_length_4300_cov_1.888598_4_plen_404_part_00